MLVLLSSTLATFATEPNLVEINNPTDTEQIKCKLIYSVCGNPGEITVNASSDADCKNMQNIVNMATIAYNFGCSNNQ